MGCDWKKCAPELEPMPLTTPCIVRAAQAEDCERMAGLALQLGYECTEQEVQRRLLDMQDSRQYIVLVAELAGNRVVGWVAAYIFRTIALETLAEVSGLIVDETLRSSGIGKRLLGAAEEWARHVCCTAISVHSNVIRGRAHRFYANNGFTTLKTQRVFHKPLSIG